MFGLGRLQDLLKKDAKSDQPPAAVDDSNIPVLDEPIPELNEKIDINDNFFSFTGHRTFNRNR